MVYPAPDVSGFTILDVLISLSAIGLLLSLMFPVLAVALEKSRLTTCRNNLRQIGMAAHSHLSATRAFPYTSTTWLRESDESQYLPVSPHRYLMAHLNVAVFEQIDFDDPTTPVWGNMPQGSYSHRNRELTRHVIPVLCCPADRPRAGGTNYRANMGTYIRTYPPLGQSPLQQPDPRDGAFVNGRALRDSEFTGGMSSTVLFSERVFGDFQPTVYDPFRDVFSVGATAKTDTLEFDEWCRAAASRNPTFEFSYSGAAWLLGGYSHTWYNHVRLPMSSDPDCGQGPRVVDGGASIISARSFHRGGVSAVFADGSVAFVSSGIDYNVWNAMGSRRE